MTSDLLQSTNPRNQQLRQQLRQALVMARGDVSQRTLGDRIGLSQSRVAALESESHNPTLASLAAYLEACGLGWEFSIRDHDGNAIATLGSEGAT